MDILDNAQATREGLKLPREHLIVGVILALLNKVVTLVDGTIEGGIVLDIGREGEDGRACESGSNAETPQNTVF